MDRPLTEDQRQLVERFIPFAHWAVNTLKAKRWLPATLLDREELTSAAYLGLCRAASRFDSNKSAFGTYAMYAIRSAVADAATRSRVIRMPSTAFNSKHFTRIPAIGTMTDLELSANELFTAPETQEPTERDDTIEYLESLTTKLDERSRFVLQQLYSEQQSMRRVGQMIGMSHESVRQIKRKAIIKLRHSVMQVRVPHDRTE